MFQVDNREIDLPNRHFFNTRLTEVIARSPSGKIVVLFLKIERLMKIKESFGSAFYYKLSDQLTDRLKEVIAPSSYLSMIDDDAFAFFLVNTEQITNIDQQCRQILQQFQTPFQIEGLHIKLYVKIGTSIFPDHGNEPEQLLKNAYYALCKENGDEYNEYDPAIVHEQRQQFIIESELHRALLRDELFLMYQPQLHLKKNEVTGVEALIRWNHPTKGIISPALFIPIAEKSELILQIGEWVLETACKQLKKWHVYGHRHLHMSINLSVRQFQKRNVVERLKEIIDKNELDPSFMELEITESMAMTHTRDTLDTLQRMKRLGVKIALDDFGTGYSSLNHLKQLPIDRIKIDQSFIQDLSDPETATIVTTMIHMAKKLNIDVIAEGVESFEQFAFLKANGCETMQGYFISPPVASEEMMYTIQSLTKKAIF